MFQLSGLLFDILNKYSTIERYIQLQLLLFGLLLKLCLIFSLSVFLVHLVFVLSRNEMCIFVGKLNIQKCMIARSHEL